jgi:hypothetical protein
MKNGELVEQFTYTDSENSNHEIEIRQFLNMKILSSNTYFDKIEEIAKQNNCHAIKIKTNAIEKKDENKIYELLTSKGFFLKPDMLNNIQSTKDIASTKNEFLEQIKKEKRKRVKKLSKEVEIVFHPQLFKEDFNKWLPLYEEMMQSKKMGRIIADEKWYDSRNQDQNKTIIGMYAYEKESKNLLGATMLVYTTEDKDNTTLISAFKASKSEWVKKGINDLFAFHFLLKAKELNCKNIKSGSDTNLYGHHLSTGLYYFKREWGFLAIPSEVNKMKYIKIIDNSIFDDIYFFISTTNPIDRYNKENLRLDVFIKNGITDEKKDEYLKKTNKHPAYKIVIHNCSDNQQ